MVKFVKYAFSTALGAIVCSTVVATFIALVVAEWFYGRGKMDVLPW